MPLSSNDYAFTLYIFQDDFVKLKSLYPHVSGSATEGSLYGLWTSTLNPVVHVVSERCHESMVRKGLAERYKMSYLGEWRLTAEQSRPGEFMDSPPSEFQPGAPGFLSVHVGAHGNITPYMYERPADRNPKSGSVEPLRGDNPFSTDQHTLDIVSGRSTGNTGQWQGRPMPTGAEAYERYRSQQQRHNYDQPHQSRRPLPAAGEPANTKSAQWYSSDGGEKKLKSVFARVKQIAQQEQVEMSRDAQTQDMTMSFKSRTGKDWSIEFPSSFPRVGAMIRGIQDRSGAPTFSQGGTSCRDIQAAMKEICSVVRYA